MCNIVKRITGDYRDNWNVISKDNDCTREPNLDKSRVIRVGNNLTRRIKSQAYIFYVPDGDLPLDKEGYVVQVWPKVSN